MRNLLVLTLLLLSTVTWAGEKPDTFVVASDGWDNCTNVDGSGAYFDLFRMIYEPEGIKMDIQIVPYERSVKMVEAGRADVWMASYWEEEEFALFPNKDSFINYDKVVALTQKGKPLQDPAELAGKKLGWIRGYGYDEYLDVQVNKYEIDKRELGIKMVKAGRLDAYLDNQSDVESDLSAAGVNKDDFEYHQVIKLYFYPAFSSSAKGQQLRDIWNRRYAELKGTPEFVALMEKIENL